MAEVETKDAAVAPAEVEPQNEPKEESKPAPKEAEPEAMRCIRLTGHGGYSKLRIEKQPKPKATEGHVVVKVHACGLNFADLMQRQGSYSETPKVPFTPGFECAGVVEEIGEHVTGIEVGARVICIVQFGAWAEYVSVLATACFVMPESMTFEEGAAFPITYLTAYLMLFHCGNIKKRKSVLIHMAAGGVGTAATQLCKTVEGVTIFGTASASKHEMIKEFGVDHPIDYRTQDYVHVIKEITHGIDLILDPLSGSDTKKCYDLLNPMGAMVCFGYANQISESKGMFSAAKNWFQGVAFNPMKMMADNKTVCGFHLGRLFGSMALIQDAMKDLLKMFNDGALKPCIDSVFALEEVTKAQQKMHERKNIGKILLSPLKEPEPEPEPEPKKKKKSGSKLEAEQKPKEEAEEAKPEEAEKESKQEEPKQEEPKQEEPQQEETKEEESKQEEPKQEETKQEEPKKEEPKEEEPKKEEPKKEEPKKEEQTTPKEEPAQPKEEEKTPEEAAAAEEPAKEEPATPDAPAAAAEHSSDEVKEEIKEEEPKKQDDENEKDKMEEGKKEEPAEPPPSTESKAKEDEQSEQSTEM